MEEKIDPYPDDGGQTTTLSAWQIIKSYWCSKQRFPAYIYFSIILALGVPFIGLDVIFNYLYYYYYDVLYSYDKQGLMKLLLVASMFAGFYLLFTGYRIFLTQLVSDRWRQSLTKMFVSRFLQNADARIQQDVRTVVNASIDTAVMIISVITTFFAFIYVLYQLSDEIVIGSWHIPGYLVWAGILYAVVGIVISIKMRRPVFAFNINQQHKKTFFWLSAGSYQLSCVLPLMFVLPGIFDKVFLFSWLFQSLQAFNHKITDSLDQFSITRAE